MLARYVSRKRTSESFLLSAVLLALVGLACVFAAGCSALGGGSGKPSIVVTYSAMGSLVRELVGDKADVKVPMPDGQDPHEWEPSARDIQTFNNAKLIVRNGLDLEGGLEKTLEEAEKRGVKMFVASEHIQVRRIGPGEGIPSNDPDQQTGAEDPHIWMDPLTMKQVVAALATQINEDLGMNVSDQAASLSTRLDQLDAEVRQTTSTIPADKRKLVTGHESLGYFAQRYQFKLVGAIVPSVSSQAETSAADLAALRRVIQENGTPAIFTELGTSPAVAQSIGRETGAKVIELTTHSLPKDGSYFTFMRDMARVITDGLK
jgi:zinc/manganese transport system substrate-binding protein